MITRKNVPAWQFHCECGWASPVVIRSESLTHAEASAREHYALMHLGDDQEDNWLSCRCGASGRYPNEDEVHCRVCGEMV